jgi:hypothetical protein
MLAETFEQRVNLRRIFISREHTAEEQRQGDDADRVRIAALIGARQSDRLGHDDPQVSPQPLASEIQFLEGRAEGVLRNHQPGLRRHDQPLDREHSDCRFAVVTAEKCDGRQQLPEQRDDDGDIDGDAGRARFVEELRQPPARREIGNELEPIGIRAIEPAQVHIRRVANGGKSRDPFGERRYKSGLLDEQGRKIEAFDLVACFGVDPVRSRAESIKCERERSVSH